MKHRFSSMYSYEELLDEDALSSHAMYAFLPFPAL